MEILNLHVRDTHVHSDGWSHLDEWTELETIKVLGFKKVHNSSNNQGSSTQWKTTVIGLKGVATNVAARALYDYFGTSTCRHEYDCCGCKIVRPSIKKVGRDQWRVKLDVSHNY